MEMLRLLEQNSAVDNDILTSNRRRAAEHFEYVEQVDRRDLLLPHLHQILDSVNRLRGGGGNHLPRDNDWADRVDADTILASGLHRVVAVETEQGGLVAETSGAPIKAADRCAKQSEGAFCICPLALIGFSSFIDPNPGLWTLVPTS